MLPQSEVRPSIVVQVIFEPKKHHLRGGITNTTTRVQVDCYVPEEPTSEVDDPGETFTTLWQAVDDVLDGKTFNVGGSPDVFVSGAFRNDRKDYREVGDDGVRRLRMFLDYDVWWKPL